jgi:hypothetical protein
MNMRRRVAAKRHDGDLSGGAGVPIVAAALLPKPRASVARADGDACPPWARLLAIRAALLLIIGVTLTDLNLLLIGWSVFVATSGQWPPAQSAPPIAAPGRVGVSGWQCSWWRLLAAPDSRDLADYAHRRWARDELPVWTRPGPHGGAGDLGGLAFFGLARGAHALPTGIGWLFVGAAAGDVVAALYVVSPYAWVRPSWSAAIGLLAGVSLRSLSRRLSG